MIHSLTSVNKFLPVGCGCCQLKTTKFTVILLEKPAYICLTENTCKECLIVDNVFFIQWWQVGFIPPPLKGHFSLFIIDLHIFYIVFCSAALCFSCSGIPHFSVITEFKKNYF